jgi:hypothetical protein
MVRSDLVRLDRRAVAFGLAAAAVTNSLTGRAAFAADKIKPSVSSVLLVVDVQNCLPGGSMAVKDGDQVIPVINKIAKGFDNVVLTQDWHTPRHISFASSHPGKKPFETIDLPYGKQILWPDHCVQGTAGAELAKDLDIPKAQLVVRKGYNKRRRLVFDLPRGRQENPDRADRLSQGARPDRGLHQRSCHRLLRGLVGGRRPPRRLRRLCGRGRLPRHRRPDARKSSRTIWRSERFCRHCRRSRG